MKYGKFTHEKGHLFGGPMDGKEFPIAATARLCNGQHSGDCVAPAPVGERLNELVVDTMLKSIIPIWHCGVVYQDAQRFLADPVRFPRYEINTERPGWTFDYVAP